MDNSNNGFSIERALRDKKEEAERLSLEGIFSCSNTPENIFEKCYSWKQRPFSGWEKVELGDPYGEPVPVRPKTMKLGHTPYEDAILKRQIKNSFRMWNLLESGKDSEFAPEVHKKYDRDILRWTDFWNDQFRENEDFEPVPPDLIKAVIQKESSYLPDSKSYLDAKGLMQIMPETQKTLRERYGFNFKNNSIYDPSYNIKAGIRWLMHKLYDEPSTSSLIKKKKSNDERMYRLLKAYHGWNEEGEDYAKDVWNTVKKIREK